MSYLETKHADKFYIVFRIGVGLMFFMYGIQKLLGLWGRQSLATYPDIFWFAGVSEVLIGTALTLGVFVRFAALFGIAEMIVAFIKGHVVSKGTLIPAANNGQAAALFLLAFIVILAYGAKKLSLETKLFGKEHF